MTQHSRKACILQGKNVETGHFSVWGKVSVCVCVCGGGEEGGLSATEPLALAAAELGAPSHSCGLWRKAGAQGPDRWWFSIQSTS